MTTATKEKYQLIDRKALKGMIDAKQNFQLWNVLGKEWFKAENNIPTSKWVPADQAADKAKQLKLGKDTTIVTYCAGGKCTASMLAAKALADIGYTNVYAYEGGLEDWKAGGFAFETIKA